MTNEPFAAFAPPVGKPSHLRAAITDATLRPEADCVIPLLEAATLDPQTAAAVRATAHELVTALRSKRRGWGVEALVHEYSLSSEEGVALMCLAEALLRIPDRATRDALIRDKIASGDWKAHLGSDRPLFVNAATWGLVVTGRLVDGVDDKGLGAVLTRVIARAGEPVIRRSVDLAMRLMGEQFVTGETIGESLRRSRAMEDKGFTYSYDMLGEAAVTQADAARYYADYEGAIHAIGAVAAGRGIYAGPGISIKLSALHPRYSRAQAGRVMAELLPRVKALAVLAKCYDIGLNIDAEEANRLELSLDLLEALARDPDLAGWDGLGFVVQAYGKRCPFVIDWLVDLARRAGRRIMVRLVKGAYWDAEIKRAQVGGLADFPVFTRKVHTDVSYIACARKLLGAREFVFPQFATHNAQTLATIHHLAGPEFAIGDYEFQCLHGMGEDLYENVVGRAGLDRPCRIYAPVGRHETLLAYLVRRLLENGANSSFVNRIADPDVAVDELLRDPAEDVRRMEWPGSRHEAIALPADIYPDRRNSAGMDLADEACLKALSLALQESAELGWSAAPLVAGLQIARRSQPVLNPGDHRDVVGTVSFALRRDADEAVKRAAFALAGWAAIPVTQRAACLERAADAMERRMPLLMGLIMREAGKSAPNAIAEVREAVDFLRYYALQARTELMGAVPLGPVACISPWNFPLAIFIGQVAAALVAGNPVLAKPAEETPLIAAEGVRILHEAGIPEEVLQFLPGEGDIGAALVAAPEVMGVIFTGSTQVARLIQRQLACRLSPSGKPIPLIAETGGQNAMIVDSSALPEQVVADVLESAFDSAGQRCSALRVLCLQDEIADRTLEMLKGAMAELNVGRTDRLAVDVGPVISADAQQNITAHANKMRDRGLAVEQLPLPREAGFGTFVAPTIIEIDSIDDLEGEVFGPVVHVLRYPRDKVEQLIDAINATGYGLTFGLHTRLDETVARITARAKAGNIYVNRNMVGAVVGVQPFGGSRLSGTGPKAGGPFYLKRLVQHIAAPGAPAPMPAQQRELPGPVGERNLYTLRPRGTILLFPQTEAGLHVQLEAALAAGNTVAIEAEPWLVAMVADMPQTVQDRVMALSDGELAGALIEGDEDRIASLLQDLPQRSAAVIVAQAASSEDCARGNPYDVSLLVEEVSISINTTAAGGNASLMMIG